MKRYTEHHCNHPHRNERTFLRCAIKPRVRIAGEGTFAVIARCIVPSAQLFMTLEAAIAMKYDIDRDACEPGCRHRHEIAHVDITAQAAERRAS